MRGVALVAGMTLVLLAAPSMASKSTDNMKACSTKWTTMSPADQKATTHNGFMSTCLKGSTTAAAVPAIPAGSTAECKDGSYTNQKSHQGACSGHKGVMKWL
jgi:Protein of unknown function (DUF3761)